MRRAIEHLLEDPLAEQLLQGTFTGKDTITVKVHEIEGEKKLYFETTTTRHYNLIAKGNEPNENMVMDYHATVTPDGDVTSFHDNARIECQ